MSDSDSDSSSSSSDSEEEVVAQKTVEEPKKADSDSDSDSSDDEEEKAAPAATPAKDDSDSSDSDSSDDEEEAKPATTTPAKAEENDSSDSDSDDEKEEAKDVEMKEPEKAEEMEVETFAPKKSDGPVTILFDWNLEKSTISSPRKRKLENASSTQAAKKKVIATPAPTPVAATPATGDMKPTKDYNPDDFRSAELKDTTCNVFIKGISTNVYEADIEKFFEENVAKPVSVRHKWEEARPGLAWVTFANPQQASKAVIDCNGEYIGDRFVYMDWATERKNNGGGAGRGPKNAHLKGTTSRIWVGNLHRECDKATLSDLFSDKGATTDVFIIGRDETRPQIAYVSFETNEIATTVVESFQGYSLLDQNIRLDWAEPRQNTGGNFKAKPLSEKPDGCMTVFVGRLADSVDDDKLVELFKEAGTIENIRYMERDGEFKGVAFVQFTETDATDKAVLKNGENFLGRPVRVDFAADRKKREY